MTNPNKLADALENIRTRAARAEAEGTLMRGALGNIREQADTALAAHAASLAAPPAQGEWVIDAVRDVMHEVFKYADIAAPLRGPPMTQDESLPVRKAAAAQDKIIRDMLYALASPQPAPAPVQPIKNVFSIKNKAARFPICGNCGDTFAGHEPTPPYACLPPTEPCCNAAGTFACKCNTFQPVPPPVQVEGFALTDDDRRELAKPGVIQTAPVADGAVELPPLPNTAESVAANVLRGMGYQWKNGTWVPYLPDVAPGSGSGDGAHNRLASPQPAPAPVQAACRCLECGAEAGEPCAEECTHILATAADGAGELPHAVRFFAADENNSEYEVFDSVDLARAAAQRMLDNASDDAADYGWTDEPPSIYYGIVLGACVESYREPAPEGSDFSEIVNYRLTDIGETEHAAIAALAQQRVPDAVRELPGEWREQATSIESTTAWHSAVGNHWRANVFAAHAVSRRALADDLERALATIDSQQEARNGQ